MSSPECSPTDAGRNGAAKPVTSRPRPVTSPTLRRGPMSRTATVIVAAALAAGIGIAALSATQDGGAMFRGDPAHSGVYRSRGPRRTSAGCSGGCRPAGWCTRPRPSRTARSTSEAATGTFTRSTRVPARSGGSFRPVARSPRRPRWPEARVFVGSRDNVFWAVDARTRPAAVAARHRGGPAAALGIRDRRPLHLVADLCRTARSYFGSGDGQVYAVEAGSGRVRWRFATGGTGALLAGARGR